jgi:hypothetical protein
MSIDGFASPLPNVMPHSRRVLRDFQRVRVLEQGLGRECSPS